MIHFKTSLKGWKLLRVGQCVRHHRFRLMGIVRKSLVLRFNQQSISLVLIIHFIIIIIYIFIFRAQIFPRARL